VREPLQFTAPAGGPPHAAAAPPRPLRRDRSRRLRSAARCRSPPRASIPSATWWPAPPRPSAPIVAATCAEVSVPRIAIHVFAERQDTLAAAERAGQDRRLSRATTQIRVGGVAAAVEAYQHEPTPPLIIVECLKRPADPAGKSTAGRGLRRGHQGRGHRRHQRHRPLPRADASRGQRISGRPAAAAAADRGHRRPVRRPGPPFVGRSDRLRRRAGGPGSSVAHNTAYAMSERIGANTVMVDYDLPFGTAGLDFNQDPLQRRRRRAEPARPPGPGAAGPDDGPLHRQAVAVRRARPPSTSTGTDFGPTPSRR
jgi:pilus assembly protein CpaE